MELFKLFYILHIKIRSICHVAWDKSLAILYPLLLSASTVWLYIHIEYIHVCLVWNRGISRKSCYRTRPIYYRGYMQHMLLLASSSAHCKFISHHVFMFRYIHSINYRGQFNLSSILSIYYFINFPFCSCRECLLISNIVFILC